MNYKTTFEFAEIWGLKPTVITYFCRTGKIEGAKKSGKSWLIPENAILPVDGRKKTSGQSVRLPLPIGVSDYKEAVSKYYYVDKTELIKDILDELPKVSLFTRPRRFGKTLTMDMLRVFFEKTDEDTSVYFSNKKIWFYGDKYRLYQGKYPVIYLSFKDVKFSSWSESFEKIKELFQAEYLRHNTIVKSENTFDKSECFYFNSVIDRTVTEVGLTSAFANLSKMLHDFYKVPPVIIVDEYDTPIHQGYTKGYYNEVISFMRNLFSGAFKDNPHLSFGFMTGILRVAKESIFSGMNNLIEYSVLSNKYSQYFGFTKNEVQTMLEAYGCGNRYAEVAEWYDGYLFGNTEIFNPWSVISFISNDFTPQPYWQNTGSNDIIRQIISESPSETKEQLQALLQGKSVLSNIDSSVIYPEIKENPQTIFSFLLIAGYLKIVKKIPIPIGNSFCEVAIPNKEILCIYGKEILSSINNSVIQSSAVAIQEAILSHNSTALQKHLQKYLTQTISMFDTDKEGFYHGLMLGLYAIMNNLYSVKSNRESGSGRFDIQMQPYDKSSDGIIVELKVLRKPKSQDEKSVSAELDELSKTALQQIDDKHYVQEMADNGIPRVLKFGIAFYKKQTAVAFCEETI